MSRAAPRRQRNRDREGKAGKEPKSMRGTAGWVGSDPSRALVALGVRGQAGGGKEGGFVAEGSQPKR